MMIEENFHIPVLSNKAVEFLINEKISDQILVDGTLGGGGYTKLICEQLDFSGKVISIDKDENALSHAGEVLSEFKDRIIFVNGNFADIKDIIPETKLTHITGIVLDLGLSSYQLNAEDGFSFMQDTPLDMRAYKKDSLTASEILNSYRNPLILDADALNIMARQKDLLKLIPAGSILTPHPKEFERLFGETHTDFDRVSLALQKARELNCIIVLKGHHTFIATPDGKGFFNSTGNPGMATAGSGDVLTGILTGLLAQGYSSAATAILGVYLHGYAGDIAAKQLSNEALIAGDIIETLGAAFSSLNH